jgi:hypothetical protein
MPRMHCLPKAIKKLRLSRLRGPDDVPKTTDGSNKVRFVPVGLVQAGHVQEYATVSSESAEERVGQVLGYKVLCTDGTWTPVYFDPDPAPLTCVEDATGKFVMEKRASGQIYPIPGPRHPIHYNEPMATYCIDANSRSLRWGPM